MSKNINLLSFTVFTFMFICSINVYAQQPVKYSFGLRIEPNLNWLTPDNKRITSSSVVPDFNFGLIANRNFTEKIQVGSGINIYHFSPSINIQNAFLQHATNKADSVATGTIQIAYNLRYLEIPLLLVMNTREMHNKTYYAEAGLSTAILIRAKADIIASGKSIKNINIQQPDAEDNYEIKDNSRTTTYNKEISAIRVGGVLGAGVKFGVLINSYVTTGVRFNFGLNNLFTSDTWLSNAGFSSLNVGFIF